MFALVSSPCFYPFSFNFVYNYNINLEALVFLSVGRDPEVGAADEGFEVK